MKLNQVAAVVSCLALGVTAVAGAATPSADPTAPGNPAMKSNDDMGAGQLAKGHNSFTKAEAKSRVEKAGYTGVASLMLDHDGLWQAKAMQDGKAVHVALDFKGNVAAQ